MNSTQKREAAGFMQFIPRPAGSKICFDRVGQLPAHLDLINALRDYKSDPRNVVSDEFKAAAQPRILTPGFTEYNGLMIEFVGNLVQSPADYDVKGQAAALAKRADSLMAKYKDWKTKS